MVPRNLNLLFPCSAVYSNFSELRPNFLHWKKLVAHQQTKMLQKDILHPNTVYWLQFTVSQSTSTQSVWHLVFFSFSIRCFYCSSKGLKSSACSYMNMTWKTRASPKSYLLARIRNSLAAINQTLAFSQNPKKDLQILALGTWRKVFSWFSSLPYD